jgi:uncharacterized protein YbcV (DUF1398 family)
MKLYGRITTDTGKVVGKGANKFLKFELLDKSSRIVATYMAESNDGNITLREWVSEVAGVYRE